MKYLSCIMILFMSACIKEKECKPLERNLEKVYILPEWEGGTVMPEGMRVSFYSFETGKYVQDNIPSTGGYTTLRDGEYELIICNNDSESILFKNASSSADYEATTNRITRPSYDNPAPGEETFDQPDKLWVDNKDFIQISEDSQTILVYPRQMVKEYTGQIIVEGMESVQAIRGAITGMMSRLLLKSRKAGGKAGTVFFDISAAGQGISFTFKSFGVYRGDLGSQRHYLTIEFLLPNGIARQKIDITDQMEALVTGGKLIIDKKIVIPPQPEDPDGGFDADVGKWEEVIVPIPI